MAADGETPSPIPTCMFNTRKLLSEVVELKKCAQYQINYCKRKNVSKEHQGLSNDHKSGNWHSQKQLEDPVVD